MTNKLRSVIDNKIKSCKGIYGFFPKNDHTNDQELCVKVELVELLMKEGLEEFLDAIIEEIEEQAKTTKQHIDEMKKLNYTEQDIDFNRGKTMYAIDLSQSLKQAREELSTSLTQ